MKKFISIMAIAAVLLGACQEKDDLGTAGSGEIELAGSVVDGQLAVGPDGGDFSVNVTSSADWRVSGFSEWVTLSSDSGKSGQPLTFNVQPNPGDESRTVTFKVFCADAVQAVTITQHPTYVISLTSEETVEVSSDANQVSVGLISNIEDLEIDLGGAEEWISLNNVSNAFGKKILQFDVKRSSEFKERTAELTIGGADTEDVVKVTFTQAQRDTAFIVGEQRIVKGLEAMQLELVLKTNVSVSYTVPSWITETHGNMSAEKDEDGLYSRSITMKADACKGSRGVEITFKNGSAVVGFVYVKQQNPNPVFVNIPDENLRYNLASQGWVIEEDGAKCEIAEIGMSGKSLLVGSDSKSKYQPDPIQSIEGLEDFPALESLTLGCITVEKIDVSNFPKLNELKLINLYYVAEINTGSLPITDIVNTSGSYTRYEADKLVIKGDNIENINLSTTSYYVLYYEKLQSIDVTGCPKLSTLNVDRSPYTTLKTIYMTAAQKESVNVTKPASVEIVVK